MTTIQPLILDLAVILGVAGLVTLIFQKIKQPVVLGYIVAGFIVGPHVLPIRLVSDMSGVHLWGDLGIIFLMFTLGLEFSFRKLARVGISASITALVEVSAVAFLGFLVGRILGWQFTDCVYLSAMLAISSTTIIVKTLDELKLRSRRFAQMIVAVLVVEDLIAIMILAILPMFIGDSVPSGMNVLTSAFKLLMVVGLWFITGYFFVPRFVKHVGRVGSNETLVVVSVALCLILVVFSAYLKYSTALGAFIMGSILAETTESHRIEELMHPLKDLFVSIFFVSVGMLLNPQDLVNHWKLGLVLSVIVIGGKFLSTVIGAMVTGQTLRTAVQVGAGLGQVGEFSFIIAGLGEYLKVTHEILYPLIVSTSVLTTLTAPVRMRYSHDFAVWIEERIPWKFKDFLMKYSVWTQKRAADLGRRSLFYKLLFKWWVNGLIVTAICWGGVEIFIPLFGSPVVSGFLAFIFSTPFLWGMFASFKNFKLTREDENEKGLHPKGGTLLVIRFLTLFWMGILGMKFLTLKMTLLMTLGVMVVMIAVFYKQLESYYLWFEKQFLSTFETAAKSNPKRDVLKHLAPWDAHLMRIKVHPNADVVLKALSASGLRKDHGINIVAIQRGLKTIIAPQATELILPKDELLVLGTDDQLESVKQWIENPPGLEHRFTNIVDYELRNILVAENSALNGATIRESQIQELYNATVVGLERQGRRLINPESELKLQSGDILWVVGAKISLDNLYLRLVRS
jgi:CPA2 family monovalent cation:H+ antiporter-2